MRCGGMGTLRVSRRKASGMDALGANCGRPLSSTMAVSAPAALLWLVSGRMSSATAFMSIRSADALGSSPGRPSMATSSASSSGRRWSAVGAGMLGGCVYGRLLCGCLLRGMEAGWRGLCGLFTELNRS